MRTIWACPEQMRPPRYREKRITIVVKGIGFWVESDSNVGGSGFAWRSRRIETDRVISTSFVESAVNQLIDKRMSKSQQMRWSHKGAHLLLQVRAEVVDGRLAVAFKQWYPGFQLNEKVAEVA